MGTLMSEKPHFSVCVGIMAHNEAANIGQLIKSIIEGQQFHQGVLDSVIVVSSGSTDDTNKIVESISSGDRKVTLIVEDKRSGKASAINKFLKQVKSNIIILQSADTIPAKGCYEALLTPFIDPRVGMTGGHPVPVNDRSTFLGYVANYFWLLHHKVSMQYPKMGEMVAFRNVINSIPEESAVDEVSIEALISEKGLELRYCPEAIVHNKGAETIKDFLKQRRRIEYGHLWARRHHKYKVSTMSLMRILKFILYNLDSSPRGLIFTVGAMALELCGKLLGSFDYYFNKKNPFIWEISETTKSLK
jgi:biofilm PGA synthesis N-glycosyltransferase PgaC